jgi:serine/threonine protein kinase
LLEHNQAKLADFGFSEFITNQKQEWEIRGSLVWMAPELLNKSALKNESGQKSEKDTIQVHPKKLDVYAFALILFELFTLITPLKAYEEVMIKYTQEGRMPSQQQMIQELNNQRKLVGIKEMVTELSPNDSSILLFRQFVINGGRPVIPQTLLGDIKSQIQKCWSVWPTERPEFSDLVHSFDSISTPALIPGHVENQLFWARNWTGEREVSWETFYKSFQTYFSPPPISLAEENLFANHSLDKRLHKEKIVKELLANDDKVTIEQWGNWCNWVKWGSNPIQSLV